MQCPLCLETALDARFREGIEIDICPKCQGIWLDRGEIEKLAQRPPAPTQREPSLRDDDSDSDDEHDQPRSRPPAGLSKKKSYSPKKVKTLGERIGDILDDLLP